jgi:hypothetical protein
MTLILLFFILSAAGAFVAGRFQGRRDERERNYTEAMELYRRKMWGAK